MSENDAATAFYYHPMGVDHNDGLTRDTPKLTLNAVMKAAKEQGINDPILIRFNPALGRYEDISRFTE